LLHSDSPPRHYGCLSAQQAVSFKQYSIYSIEANSFSISFKST
jgi:hypothetical protein